MGRPDARSSLSVKRKGAGERWRGRGSKNLPVKVLTVGGRARPSQEPPRFILSLCGGAA